MLRAPLVISSLIINFTSSKWINVTSNLVVGLEPPRLCVGAWLAAVLPLDDGGAEVVVVRAAQDVGSPVERNPDHELVGRAAKLDPQSRPVVLRTHNL